MSELMGDELDRGLTSKGIGNFREYASNLTALQISEFIHTDTGEESAYRYGPGEY